MTTITKKIEQFHGFKAAIEFPFLVRLEWTTVPTIPGCTHHLVLCLSKWPGNGSERQLVLEFQRVKNIKLAPESRCVVLEILDVSARQWEDVNLEVRDAENHAISFLCHDFSASVQDMIR